MKSSNSRAVVGILSLIFVFFMIFMIFMVYTVSSLGGMGSGSDFDLGGRSKDGIAVVEIKGVILDSQKIVEDLQKAEEDKRVKGIVLRIDSPGGAVGPTQEVYDEVRRIDKDKPIYASFGSIAASGGYYIGAAAQRIFANAGTLTGSIGVIMQFVNLSKLYEWAKVSMAIMKAGKYKDAGNPYRTLTEEERLLLKEMIDSVHEKFKADILAVREKTLKRDINELAQGQVFDGTGALAHGLIDEIGSMWATARAMHKKLGLKGKLNLIKMKAKKKFSLFDILDQLDESVTNLKFGIMLDNVPMLIYNPQSYEF